jgi:8-oxo-dGTP pyrophosphatase MutT (NUDIX family)
MIRQFSAGGLVYKKNDGQVEFLLKKSAFSQHYPSSNEWSLPKGWLDDAGHDEPGPLALGQKRASPAQIEAAALREVREETGVEAKISQRLKNVQFFFVDHNHEKVLKTVIFFLMEYVKELPEGFSTETSEIKWVDFGEARKLLQKRKGECEIIKQAQSIL